MRLSILICTTSAREKVMRGLMRNLNHQIKQFEGQVEIIINDHETDIVGKKRNDLLNLAKGDYVVAIDSDDEVSMDYVKLILRAAKEGSDCIGISGIITTNGRNPKQWHISKDYGSWYEKNRVYYRTPNHISPIKRELALKVMFPEIQFAEDADFSKRVLPHLKTESKVKGNIYTYKYISKK